jgi:glycerate dehydrogenase
MVVAHLLEVTNQVGHYSRRITEEGEWVVSSDFCYWNKPIIELQGLKVAIVGWGNIGEAVAERLCLLV